MVKMLATDRTFDEFDCADCGRHIFGLPAFDPPPTICAICERAIKQAHRPGRFNEFSVALFFPDSYRYEARHLDAEAAVMLARNCTERPAALAGWIKRVIITDADDYTCFEWTFGQGVTFPRPS
jgi:hypothetical protein